MHTTPFWNNIHQLARSQFAQNVKTLKEEKDITIIHGMVRGMYGKEAGDDDELSLIDENPILVLIPLV
jgi:hypothetical protein